MPHTFKVGDRVIIGDATQGYYSVSRCGEYGVLKRAYEFGYEVALDKQELNRSEGIWYVAYGDLRHETELRKGDWVRYEQTDEVIGTPRVKGHRGKIESRWSLYADVRFPDLYATFLLTNLVKIQPPQEEQMEPREEEDAIELGIQEKIRLLERQVEKAKCCLETYRDIKRFINKEDHDGTR